MRKTVATALILATCIANTAWAGSQELKVDSVKDGDTILATSNGSQVQLQLLGIDAPEDVPNPKLQRDMQRTKLDQSKLIGIGALASKHLASLVAPGQRIKVEADLTKKDRYGRIPAVVMNSAGRNLNLVMVEDGYAVVMGRYPFDEALKAKMRKLQAAAENSARGLWGSEPDTTKAWAGK